MNDSFGFEEPIIMTEDTKNRPPEKKKHEAGAIIAGALIYCLKQAGALSTMQERLSL